MTPPIPLPEGFDVNALVGVLDCALERGGDFADVFFERREASNLLLEDGLLRVASVGTSSGVGVRVVAGEKTGYSYTESFDVESVKRAARTAASIADDSRAVAPIRLAPGRRADLYAAARPGIDASPAEKVRLLERVDAAARAVDPRIVRVAVHLSEDVRTVHVATSAGVLAADVQPMIALRVRVVVEDGANRTTGLAARSARRGVEMLADDLPEVVGREAAEQGVRLLAARSAPAGAMPVVLGNAHSGVLLHEAVGHGLESDFVRKNVSRYAGCVGTPVASPLVTVVDVGTIGTERGTINVDDEGSPTGETVLIEGGMLRGYLEDALSARLTGRAVTGNGRRESYAHVPMPRMTNTLMRPGPHDPEEIIRSVRRGIYATHYAGGQVEIGKGDFMFLAKEAWLVEDGRKTTPLRDVTLIGNGPEVMSRVDMVGHDLKLSDTAGVCGKDGQSIPVGVGMPTVRISSLVVGGTEA